MISIDYREEKSGIIDLFAQKNEAEYEVKKLVYADYLINFKIAVERKTAEDFCVSIIDGRIFKQAIKMKENYDYNLVIIEGNPFKTSHNFNRNVLEGVLIELCVFLSMPVMFTKSVSDTYERIIMIRNHFETKNPGLIKRYGYKPRNEIGKMLYMLQGLPNIGKIKSKRILEHFGSIKNFVNADIAELKKVEGIDEKIAAKIYETINNNYDINK
ncbi:MAG TPA: ERCC4 domain-containing protein [bacterium]|nr:ERCC4 domain-containing protein [bacterium]